MKLQSYIPILQWLPKYSSEQLRGDLPAGLTAGVLLIPQSIAFAMIAGVPPIYGLYASTVPMILYAIFGTSRQLSVGPVSIISLLTFAGVSALAEPGSAAYIELTILLAFLVGIIQLLLGILRLGFLVNFLSHPVVSGFTSASAVIIAVGQLKNLLGISLQKDEFIYQIIGGIIQQLNNINLFAVGLGLSSILLIIILKKIHKSIPAPLVAVIFGIVMVWGFGLTDQGVKIVGDIPGGLPDFTVPLLEWQAIRELLPIALAIAIVSFTESFAVAKAMQNRHKDYKIAPNQELIALGIANIGGGFFRGFPTTGGFSRTAVNDQAGAKTSMASLISAGLIIVTLLFLTPLFYYLPNAVVAAIIIVAVLNLVDYKEAKHLLRSDLGDFAMLMATFLLTLLIGVEEGIAIGVILSLALMIYRSTRPHMAVLGRIPNSNFYKNINRFENLEVRPDVLVVRFDAQLYFANISFFENKLEQLVQQKGNALKVIILNAESINRVDSSAVHLLEDLNRGYKERGIEIFFTNVQGPVRDMLTRADFVQKIGKDRFFLDVQEAVACFDSKLEKSGFENYILQTNVKVPKDRPKGVH
ncbi:MAG: SulP family inorganic anion transporter [Saprospiraceae bacterium]